MYYFLLSLGYLAFYSPSARTPLFKVLTESDSEPNDKDLCEIWNEDKEETVSDIIRQYKEEPVPDAEIQMETVQGHSKSLST